MMKKCIAFIFSTLLVLKGYTQGVQAFGSKDYIQALKKVTDVMVNDATSPVASSRYYAYITLASYELQANLQATESLFYQKLNKYNGVKDHQPSDSINVPLAILYSVFRMGEKLLPSGYLLKAQTDSLLRVASKKNIPDGIIRNSVSVAEAHVQ